MMDLFTLHRNARREGRISRRLFLAYGAALSALPLLSSRLQAADGKSVAFASNPFTLGVASGDPSSMGVVLWTRLAPKPLEPAGGLAPEMIEVQWEVANDEAMKDVVRRGTVTAAPQLGHSVRVEAEG